MNILSNNFDSIEKIIYEEGLRIETIDFHPDLDLMLIVLNTKVVLQQRISSYKKLVTSNKEALLKYELVAKGTGVHWQQLDEDLSLKGFLQQELKSKVIGNNTIAA